MLISSIYKNLLKTTMKSELINQQLQPCKVVVLNYMYLTILGEFVALCHFALSMELLKMFMFYKINKITF